MKCQFSASRVYLSLSVMRRRLSFAGIRWNYSPPPPPRYIRIRLRAFVFRFRFSLGAFYLLLCFLISRHNISPFFKIHSPHRDVDIIILKIYHAQRCRDGHESRHRRRRQPPARCLRKSAASYFLRDYYFRWHWLINNIAACLPRITYRREPRRDAAREIASLKRASKSIDDEAFLLTIPRNATFILTTMSISRFSLSMRCFNADTGR